MSNIINFPAIRRLKRLSGEVFQIAKHPLHEVRLRINLPNNGRPEAEDLLYGHLFRLLQKLHGFDQTKGFTLDVLRGGEWHELPHSVRPKLLKNFLINVDYYCERGWLEVEVDEVLFAKSKQA
ncbi:hypothetical protein [Pseudosulfitobacter sp. DSM 107133]|uniref:hypothetical protein n=1 Tax=Pseudosulfitobacter sp. DSM 107133 TaxID=2883100 RepID=UPI0013B39383|nr:hypothetical protein [Pseudosulfitobacter sp. DSM 107133]UOA25953.1 hypothetical protein DSM107133_00642 [Pseudosulfitobacter sp. DSM 107133]